MSLVPTLRKQKVPLAKLLLDPNNPRFLEDHVERVDEREFHEAGVQIETSNRMSRGQFRLAELQESIETNGWQPVDMIFVKRAGDNYVVLEGNRRLMALRALGEDGKLVGALKSSVDPLDVLEVVSNGSADELRQQIAYLLGVRHQSSLKRWGAFAQAHDIYERYLRLGRMTDATFRWDQDIAAKIGAALSIKVKQVQERLRVYRAMKQLHAVPAINEVGVMGAHYTLIKEAVAHASPQHPLASYVTQDSSTFLLDDQSIERMDRVCRFSTPERHGAPMSNPDEWRPFAKILADVDSEKRAAMVHEVEVSGRAPSEVHAERQAELRQARWDRWLHEVALLLSRLQISHLDSDDAVARSVAKRLADVLDALPSAHAKGGDLGA